MNSFIRIKLSTLYRVWEFFSYGNYNPLIKYTITMASFDIYVVFLWHIYSHNSQVYTLDKTSDAACNLYLNPFNFTIIFHDDKKDENKVIGNAGTHVNSTL